MKKKLLINDIILIVIIIGALITLSVFLYRPSSSDNISIMFENEFYAEYSLDTDTVEQIGSSGVILEIKNGQARIIESPCDDKICVNSKAITKNSSDGASIVCLPFKVALTKGSSTNSIKEADAVAG